MSAHGLVGEGGADLEGGCWKGLIQHRWCWVGVSGLWVF